MTQILIPHDLPCPDDWILHPFDDREIQKWEFLSEVIAPQPLLFPYYFYPGMTLEPAIFHSDMLHFFLTSNNPINIAIIPRGFGKTTLIGKGLLSYSMMLLRIKGLALYSRTATIPNATIRKILTGLNSENSLKFFGPVYHKKKKEGVATNITCDPWGINTWIFPRGLAGAIRGLNEDDIRPVIGLIDDTEKTGDTTNMIEKITNGIASEVLPGLDTDISGFEPRLWWLGTPVGKDCAVLRAERDWNAAVFRMPAMIKGPNGMESTWPAKWSTKALLELKEDMFKTYREHVWHSEYMLDPQGYEVLVFTGGPGLFRRADIDTSKIKIKIAVDLALTSKTTSCSTGIVAGGYQGSKFYCLKAKEGKWKPDVIEDEVIKMVKEIDKFNKFLNVIYIESAAFDLVARTLRVKLKDAGFGRIALVSVTAKNRDKVDRIAQLIPKHNGNGLLIEEECRVLRSQIEKFPVLAGGVDTLDALAHCVEQCHPEKDEAPPKPKRGMMEVANLLEQFKRDQELVKRMYRGYRRGYPKGFRVLP